MANNYISWAAASRPSRNSTRRARKAVWGPLALFAGVTLAIACTDVQRSLPRPEGAFGTLCTADDTCEAKACVPHMGGTVCSRACDARHPCPADWSCWTPPETDASGADAPGSYCVSSYWALCRPCDADVDCSAVGAGGIGNCVDYDHQGSFCGNACEASTDCPEGYMCEAVTTADGRATKACVHASGFCPCTPYLAALGAPTRCHQSNAYGVCAADRTCDSKSWSPCTAAEPAPEIPNLLDDDCDGITDEDACFCGDTYCDAGCGESLANCPCDCASSGDGICSPCGENPTKNPEDCCRTTAGTTGCGDGVCLGFGCGENPTSCEEDCGAGCGNQVCEPGENPTTCEADCSHQVCGNHVCEPTDGGPAACPGDCSPTCGDCVCDPVRDESVHNCPIDCGYCGDGICSACTLLGETRRTCARDCCEASAEICNSIDDDCDGDIDEENAGLCVSFYADADHDGLGDPASGRCLCGPTAALPTRIAGDCDDHAEAIGAGPAESCNAFDDDCDGGTDEDFGVGDPCAAPGGACWDGAIACDGPDRTTCADSAPRAAGSLCRALACVDGLVRPTATCDDAGGCVVLPWVACGGYACEASGRCLDACATNADCRTGFACGIEHTCEQVAPDCTTDASCIDQDWETTDLCIAVCAHPPRDDAAPPATPDADEDGDGVSNAVDVCPETADPAQLDSDQDGIGDACDRCAGPGADETCNGLDDDCDGSTDEGFAVGLSCVAAGDRCRVGKLACDAEGKPECVADHAAPVGFMCGVAGCEGSGLRLGGTCAADGSCQTGALVACNGYRCAESPDQPDNCMTSCADDSHCTSDYTCVATPNGGRCSPKKSNGEACGKDAECWHGHCVDGVCCESACTETCFTCAGPGSAGSCVPALAATDPGGDCGPCALCDALGSCAPVEATTDPKGACLAQGGCGTTGTCDGLGACALGAALTPCGEAECIDGRLTTAGTCDGEGGCLGVTTEPCEGNFACGPGALTCLSTCASDRQCAEGYFCNSLAKSAERLPATNSVQGKCLPLRGKGIGCSASNECESGQCVDGVCCTTACTGNCLTCAKAGAEGTCLAVAVDTDPDDDCGVCDLCDGQGGCKAVPAGKDPASDCTEVPGGCTQTGACDGTGACALRASTTVCSQAHCVGSAYVTAQTCDGRGACPTPTLTACSAYRCDDAGVACRSSCTADAHCQSGYYCTSVQANGLAAGSPGQCKARETLGAECARNVACESGNCADGRCCNAACGDLCQSCALEGKLGTCSALDAVTDGACAGSFICADGTCAMVAGLDCQAPGECASGFCENGTCCASACAGQCQSCAEGTCADVRLAQNLGRCEGANWCDAEGGCSAIAGAACDPLLGCPEGWACIDGVCATPRALGAACDVNGDCASDACADGVCCDSACEGTCMACGSDGRCATAAIGSADPGCTPGAVCGLGGACGTPSGAACPMAPGVCASGQCVDGVCCASSCAGACTSCATGTCAPVGNGLSDPGTCDAPAICLSGTCTMLSDACDSDNDCGTQQCFIIGVGVGVCCDKDCGGLCETCVATMGTCSAVTRAENAGRCDDTKWCDAGGSCVPKAGQACNESSPCAEGYYCGPQGTCAAIAATGTGCTTGDGCASGFCVDGVCCESACEGACRYCANAGALGKCLVAPTGTDPAGDCGAGMTCSREAGACRAANGQACGSNDAACASGACTDGVCCASACGGACETCAGDGTAGACTTVRGRDDDLCQGPLTCDQTGACLLAAGMPCELASECESGSCTAGVCCPSGCGSACEACMPDGSCVPVLAAENPERCEIADGEWCNANGNCVPVSANGQDCGVASDCTSGNCVDGVCCESACDGTCEVCNVPGRLGSCERATAGTDPHAQCAVGQTCDAGGVCRAVDGTGCDTGAACASGLCVDGVCCDSACEGTCEACNGVGSAGRCSPVIGTVDADTCAAPWQCGADGTCLMGLGQPCASDGQCASGECENAAGASGVDFRVCCQTNCDGACQNCAAGSGACQPLTRVEDAGLCVDPSWCDGAGACLAKAAARCKGSDAHCPDGYYCDTSVVGSDGDSACLPAASDGGECNTDPQCESGNCRAGRCCDVSCADPFTCDATGECGLPDGLPCASDEACVGGLCVDGVCCATTCGGECMACDTPARLGVCAPVTGTDESCAGSCDNGTCTEGVGCDEARPCPDGSVCYGGLCIAGQIPSGGACVTGSQCVQGECVDGVCCQTACAAACYACDGLNGGVLGVCSPISGVDMACFGGTMGTCVAGTCLGGPGAQCSGNEQCMSGICTGNMCSDSPGAPDAGH